MTKFMPKESAKGLRIKLSEVCSWLYAVCAVANVWLAFNSKRYSPLYALITALVVYLTPVVGFSFIFQNEKNRKISKRSAMYCLIPAVYILILVVNTYGGYGGDWIISFVTIALFLIMDEEIKRGIFEKFYKIIQVQNIVSVTIYLMFVLNLRFIFTRVPFYYEDTSLGFYYLKSGIWGIVANDTILSYRLCGIFNEAGALGTICALLFIITFRFTKMWEKVLLVAAIIFSFSLAGFLLLFLFAAVYLIRKDMRNIVWLVFLFAFFLCIPYINWHNDSLNLLAQRFSLSEGGIAGDNRTTGLFDIRFDELMSTSKKWLGYGAGYSLAGGVLSYKTYIVEFGIIGMITIISSWILSIIKAAKKNLDCYVFGLFFIISLYQRPAAIRSILGYVLIFGGFAYVTSIEKKRLEGKEIKT